MKNYEILIGKEKFNLIINNQSYEPYFEILPKNAYGKLVYTYDESIKSFRIKLMMLSERAKYLIENGWLCVAATTRDSKAVYGRNNDYSSTMNRTSKGNPIPRFRGVYAHHRDRNWICCYSGSTEETRNEKSITNVKLIHNKKDEIIFPFSDIVVPKSNIKYGIWDPFDDAYMDIRFYLFTNRGSKRFCKTLCEPFRLIKSQTQ